MRTASGDSTHVERLADDLFQGVADDALAAEIGRWLAGSRRFRAFATTHRAKIHKKLRVAADGAARADVRAELRVAHLLLADARLELAFEAHGSGKAGPDFTVAMRGEQALDLEVTRLRSARALGSPLLAKLRQFQPAVPNLLVIAMSDSETDGLDVAAVVRDLRARADRKDDAFFASRGLADARGFYERFLRLGGVVIWREDAAVDARALLWVNRSARIALPDRASRAVLDALRDEPRRPSAATT